MFIGNLKIAVTEYKVEESDQRISFFPQKGL